MNEHTEESSPTDSAPDSRCDDYESYLEEEYGYAYAAREIVPLQELESHDALLADPDNGLGGRGVDDLNDFELLGRARGYRRAGQTEAFLETTERIFGDNPNHPAVDYAEVHLLAALGFSQAGDVQRAVGLLDKCADNWSDMVVAAGQLKAVVLIQAGRNQDAQAVYDGLADSHGDDPEMFFEIAEDLVRLGEPDRASAWLDRAATTAERVGDDALSVDIRLLREQIARGGTGDSSGG